jgi:uncharacterized protein (DUF433 family)
VRDLPISVDEVLNLLDLGKLDAEISQEYPDLTPEDLDEVRRFGPALRQPKADTPTAPAPAPAPVIPAPAPKPAAPAAAPAAPKRRVMRRIRLDDLGIYYCIRGLPISVDEVIARLDAGASKADLLAEFPALEPDDIEEVTWYRDRMRQS